MFLVTTEMSQYKNHLSTFKNNLSGFPFFFTVSTPPILFSFIVSLSLILSLSVTSWCKNTYVNIDRKRKQIWDQKP